MKLESLKSDKFQPLTISAMQQIRGGDQRTDGGTATVGGKTFDFDHDQFVGETTEYYDKNNKLIAKYPE